MKRKPTYKELERRRVEQDRLLAERQRECKGLKAKLQAALKKQEVLRESEAKFKTLFENVKDEIIFIDMEGTILEINDGVEAVMGFTREEVIGKNFAEVGFLRPHLNRKVMKLIRDVVAGRPTQMTEYEGLRKDGSPVYVEANPRLVRKDGQPIGILTVIRDITERRKAQEALQESEEKARALLNATTDAVMLLDRDGRILDLNGTYARRFQMPLHRMRGLSLWDLLPSAEAQRRKAVVARVFENGESVRFEEEADGTWSDRVIYPVFDAHGDVSSVAVFSHDITPLKQAEQELLKHRNHLEELVKERTANLEETNIALKVLLKKREEDKAELEESLLTNVKELVFPVVEKMKKCTMEERARSHLATMETNLKEMILPFMRGIYNQYPSLTPTEMQVVNFLIQGKRTKEIADALYLSPRTVEFHRNNIRKKLGINKKRVNLRTYLLSLQ